MVNFYIQREGEASVDIEALYSMIIMHVEGLHPSDYKPVHKREWANEDGVSITFPDVRRTRSRDIIITAYIEGSDYIDKYNSFIEFVSAKKFDYWDTLRNKKVSLIFDDKSLPNWIAYNSDRLQFSITLLNYSGRQIDVV